MEYNADLILLQSPLNLQQPLTLPDKTGAILFGKKGVILHTAAVDIGYRTAYYTDKPYGTVNDAISMYGTGDGALAGYQRNSDHTLWGPMAGVQLRSGLGRMASTTDENGSFVTSHLLHPAPRISSPSVCIRTVTMPMFCGNSPSAWPRKAAPMMSFCLPMIPKSISIFICRDMGKRNQARTNR